MSICTERLKEAEEIFLEAIELIPDQESTYNNLGKVTKKLSKLCHDNVYYNDNIPCSKFVWRIRAVPGVGGNVQKGHEDKSHVC